MRIVIDYCRLGGLALQRLDPFDFDGDAVSAQGDCSWGGDCTELQRGNAMKDDLQNSTAFQGDCSWEGYFVVEAISFH